MCALDDLAARLNMDPVEFFGKNLDIAKPRQNIYREELAMAADLMGWKQKWHPRRQNQSVMVRGVGVSFHTWGGRGHASDCDLTIHPDGSVELKLGSQDLGTGTRTCILIVAADTLGLPLDAIQLQIGDTIYPPSGGSGGSTTIGGVSSSTRRAAVDARDALLAKVTPCPRPTTRPASKSVNAESSVSRATPAVRSAGKRPAAKLGVMPLTAAARTPTTANLRTSPTAASGGCRWPRSKSIPKPAS